MLVVSDASGLKLSWLWRWHDTTVMARCHRLRNIVTVLTATELENIKIYKRTDNQTVTR